MQFTKSTRVQSCKLIVYNLQIILTICLGLLLQGCGPEQSNFNPVVSQPTNTTLVVSITPTPSIKTSPINITPTLDKPSSKWQDRWLQKIPCMPPCWEGITPGITTSTEALAILNQKKDIARTQIIPTRGPFVPSKVAWEWVGGQQSPGNSPDGGGVALFNQNEPIFLINPYLESPFVLADIIKVYGDPSHILAGFNRNHDGSVTYFYELVYLSLGFSLDTSGTSKFNITPPTSIKSIVFFASGFEGYKKSSTSEEDYKYIVPWQGFKSFDFYCQTREKNDKEDCSKI